MKPRISYVICATPRSGSHLLSEALQNTGLAGVADEYFICNEEGRLQNETGWIAELYGQKTLPEFLDLVLEVGSTPNGVFGIIMMGGYFHTALANFQALPQYAGLEPLELMDALFGAPKYIWLTRRDRVRQAVSWAKATQTDVWRQLKDVSTTARRKPKFDFNFIDLHHRLITKGEARWEEFFRSTGVEPFRVTYKDLEQSYEQTALDVLDFLGVPYPDDLVFGERRMQRQASRLNQEWAEKYVRVKRSPVLTFAHLAKSKLRKIRNYLPQIG